MLNMFSKLCLDIPEHRSFAGDIIEELTATQRQLVSVKTFRNFPNCSNHLRKHRVCCALLVLDTFVSEVSAICGIVVSTGLQNVMASVLFGLEDEKQCVEIRSTKCVDFLHITLGVFLSS